MYLNTLFLLIIITNLFLNNKTYLEVSMHKFTKILILFFLSFFLTGCVECTLLLDYSKTTSPKLETEFYIEEDTLKKYNMNIKEIKKQITSYDLFKQWEIHDLNKTQKNQKYVGFQLIAPSSFTKEITTLKKKKNQYDLTISIDPSLLDISELNHYKSTLKLLDSSDALCQMKVIMPGTITYSNYGKYLNNTLTINLFDVFINQVDLSFHVTSKKNHQQLYLYLITLFLLGCLIIYLIFFKIRQKKS